MVLGPAPSWEGLLGPARCWEGLHVLRPATSVDGLLGPAPWLLLSNSYNACIIVFYFIYAVDAVRQVHIMGPS